VLPTDLVTEAPERLLDRVRKLLAKAEDEAVTPAEAQALTAKAAELMAKYGIDRALLAADRPETDQPANRVIDIDHPWAREKAHLLCGLAAALRCQCILLSDRVSGQRRPGSRVHIFGFASDLERTDVLYTSVLIQMWHGLAGARVPDWASSPRAWRRSWLLGFATAVVARVRAAEHGALAAATTERTPAAERTAVVLADRSLVIRRQVARTYPVTRTARVTYSGNGYRDGYAEGQRADIGGRRLHPGHGRALTTGPRLRADRRGAAATR
jgi:hypothetical protein